ncbi:carbohydrate ABC transporter permease [Haloplasma contractile]|uniref:ABC-type sugar transport system permease component protein n=1 Tax=Haloplasma contractile SSD-17B TaxID=1033810 RepID=U2FKN7_9MOLU|nr:sugar ABC transporter permease [Haloplasma contractile]ERJ13360.1 ABC-type sugar transport system permease component protein [Haloplasma contractile SSD-17B]
MRSYKRVYFLFIAPVLIAFTLFMIIPFLLSIYYSFTDWRGIEFTASITGIDNYKRILTDEGFIRAFWFTFKFSIINILAVNSIAFLLAFILTRKIRGKDIFRTIFFIPNLIGGLILGYIWQFIFNGIILPFFYLGKFGITSEIGLNSDPKFGFWGLVVLSAWQMAGYMMVIYIAAIQNIPKELVEASDIDGATLGQKIRHIVIPLIMPAVTISLFLTASNSFKLFDQNLALTEGGPAGKTEMLALSIYNAGGTGRYGLAQAQAIVFFVLVSLITLIQVGISKRKEVEA